MTEMFKNFVLDVDDTVIEEVIHFVNDNYDIVTEHEGKQLLISNNELNNYYQAYTLGRKTYSQTVVRTGVAINKTIMKFFNIDFS